MRNSNALGINIRFGSRRKRLWRERSALLARSRLASGITACVCGLCNPDDNGLELYRDRPKEEWPRTADGSLAMDTRPFDLDALLREG